MLVMRSNRSAIALLFILGWVGMSLAYPENFGPFPDAMKVERIALTDLIMVSRNPDFERLDPEAVFEPQDAADTQLIISQHNDGRYVRLGKSGETVLPLTFFSESVFSAGLTAESGDLNRDGILDFIIYSNYGGCGLGAGYCDVTFILSHGGNYYLSTVLSLYPHKNDFVILNGSPCFIHTSFQYGGQCNDGKRHNFWIYNLLVFGDGGLRLDNTVHVGFPKTIWYSYESNHSETTLLSREDKAGLLQNAVGEIGSLKSSEPVPASFEALMQDGAVDRETARETIQRLPKIQAMEKPVIENGGLGVVVYPSEQPVRHLNRDYWEVHVHQNYPDRHPRIETFLVRTDGDEILILNPLDAGPRYTTLKESRWK